MLYVLHIYRNVLAATEKQFYVIGEQMFDCWQYIRVYFMYHPIIIILE